MIRRASTAALRDSSELLSLRQTRTLPPGWRMGWRLTRDNVEWLSGRMEIALSRQLASQDFR